MEWLTFFVSVISLVLIIILIYWFWSKKKLNPELDASIITQLVDKITLILLKEQNRWQKDEQEQNYKNANQIQENLQKLVQNGQTEVLTKLNTGLKELKEEQNQNLNNNQRQLGELKTENQNQLMAILEQIKKSLSAMSEDINKQNAYNFDTLNKANQERLNNIQEEIQKKFDQSMEAGKKSFEETLLKMQQMENSAQQMLEATKPMNKLVNIFERTNSKAFGSFAEDYLEALLTQHLNKQSWIKQAQLAGSKEIIDFIIYFGDKKVGIDVKFPLTSYEDYIKADYTDKNEKLKKFFEAVYLNVQSIAGKYSKTGYLDYLIMYVPSDGMYAEISNSSQLLKQLAKLNVKLASPATILPIISIIQEYQHRQFMHTHADEIIRGFKLIKNSFMAFGEEYRKLGDKLNDAQNNYTKAGQNLRKIDTQLLLLDSDENQASKLATDQTELI